MKKALVNILLAIFTLLSFSRAWGQPAERTVLLKFTHAPFPLNSKIDDPSAPFFDVNENGRRGHNSPRGGVYWEDTTYSDNRVLLSLSPGFKPAAQPVIVVYFHGNQSMLERDLIERHHLTAQFASAGLNALLVAPQFALDALDSSSGRFAEAGFFARFMKETAEKVARWQKNQMYRYYLDKAPIVLVAYSGGYLPASNVLERGGIEHNRVAGVILLDALYGNEDKFADWIKVRPSHHFFFSAYTQSTRPYNEVLQKLLSENCIAYGSGLPERLAPGRIGFLDLGDEISHSELPAHAWSDTPFRDLMVRVKKHHANSHANNPAAKRRFAARADTVCRGQ